MKYHLRLTGTQHVGLRSHLFPGDGQEAVAVALCGRRAGDEVHVLTVRELTLIQHTDCRRTATSVTWDPTCLAPLLNRAAREGGAIVKFHSHPCELPEFSQADDRSDALLFDSVFGWTGGTGPHGSAIMLPDGSMFGRVVRPNGTVATVERIMVAGDDILIWDSSCSAETPTFASSHAQLFGEGTAARLARLRIGVVGCSGTGSFVIEQLARLGVGCLVLVDPDHVEERNLNRIVGATRADANAKLLKVDVMARSIDAMDLGAHTVRLPHRVQDQRALTALAECDVLFGCVDSVSARNILNRLARHYVIPYFDVGVKLEAAPNGEVGQVAGAVHYLRPDGDGLRERGVFTPEDVAAEDLRHSQPDQYRELRERNYIVGVQERRPAVVSVNGFFSSLAVNELLARLHPFRSASNASSGTSRISLTNSFWVTETGGGINTHDKRTVGLGDVSPLLGMPGLGAVPAERGA